ncbi:MAG: NUDIX hydrolase [Candidatus Colwellbacteria bacterium]|nr:NUDIX hydrolase [Candidatus Colwellbacteria bacterium]
MKAQIKVGVLVVNERSEVLLIKEKPPNIGQAKWNIIKGTHEDNGETIFETAIRECQEEASIDVELTHALGVYLYDGDRRFRIQFNFLAVAKNSKAIVPDKDHQELRNENISEAHWFRKEEVLKLEKSDYLSEITYQVIQGCLKDGKKYPLEIYNQPHQV